MTERPPSRVLRIGGAAYPVFLPNIRDPRLHVAAVIISVHVLGQVALHFRVSVIEILAAILTCWIIEVGITFYQKRAFYWPASAMLTGSGVALIFRVVGTPADDPWNPGGWPIFAIVAGLSLLTKYVIRYRGNHVFNPSNIGLVVAFVVLGSARVEPLDFWWAPLNAGMLAAYAVILGGGVLITRRLRLLPLAVAFWLTLATGVGVLAASGHCMTANWAFAPVCGGDFWRIIVTSPEVLIFLFFMITDPQTVPGGRVGRVVFGVLVGIVSTLLLAPQTDEFGTKVGLLAGLVLVCAFRPLVDRLVPEPRSAADTLRAYLVRLRGSGSAVASAVRIGALALVLVLVGGGIVVAGGPARGTVFLNVDEVLNRVPVPVNPSTLPEIAVDQGVIDFDHRLAGDGMQPVLVTLMQNLELENQALLRKDGAILTAVDHGDRLAEMQARLADAVAGGQATVTHYAFDRVSVALLIPFGRQTGLSLGLASTGTRTDEVYAGGTLISRQTAPFSLTFAMRQALGTRWLNVAVLAGQVSR